MRLQITIDDKLYDVEVEIPAAPPRTPPYSAPPPATAPVQSNGDGAGPSGSVCRSPIGGVVIRVNVQAGQQLQAGDLILVLEAMKMESNVTAPLAGKVKSIHVEAGEAVQKDQVLVEFA